MLAIANFGSVPPGWGPISKNSKIKTSNVAKRIPIYAQMDEQFAHVCTKLVDVVMGRMRTSANESATAALLLGRFSGRAFAEQMERATRFSSQITRQGILNHARAVLENIEEKDVFSTSFDQRTRNSAVKEYMDTGSRRSMVMVQEIASIEMVLGDISKLDRLDISCFFRRAAGLLTGKNCFAIFERLYQLRQHKPRFVKQPGSLEGPGAISGNGIVAGDWNARTAGDESWGSILNGWQDSKCQACRWKTLLRGLQDDYTAKLVKRPACDALRFLSLACTEMLTASDTFFQFLSCEEGKIIKYCVRPKKRSRRDYVPPSDGICVESGDEVNADEEYHQPRRKRLCCKGAALE